MQIRDYACNQYRILGGEVRVTVARDERNLADLRRTGWRVAIVWECALKGKSPDDVAQDVATWLLSDKPELVIK